jgi:hypothetical protein
MANINIKNYKNYLLDQKSEKLPKKKRTSEDVFSKFIAIKHDPTAKVTIRKKSKNGRWLKSQAMVDSLQESDSKEAGHTLAKLIQSENTDEIYEKYQVRQFSHDNYLKYSITGNGSVKELAVGVFSSEADDEAALHLLLKKTRDYL